MFRPRVLIAEADASLAASIMRQFTATGWDAVHVTTAPDVVTAIGRQLPDVVLLDASLGGLDLLERLRADRANRHVKIVMMAVDCDAALQARFLAAGAFTVLALPLRIPSIEALQKIVLGNASAPRVLISDDDNALVRVLERAARREGLEPVTETDPSQVLGLAKEVHPDVIVLDINQGRLDGRDVLARLKEDPETRDIRVVMLTGVEDQLTRHDCLSMGADDYVVKPLDPLFFVRIARKIGEAQLN